MIWHLPPTNLAMESKVYSSLHHLSLHPYCYHQITYVEFNLKVSYPTLYGSEIWPYEQANVHHIRKAADLLPWDLNKRDKTFSFKKRLKLLFPIIFLVNQLHLMIEILRGLTDMWKSILEKNKIYKKYVQDNGDHKWFDQVKCL